MKRGLPSQLRWTKPGSAPRGPGEAFACPPEPRPRTSTGLSVELYGVPKPYQSPPATVNATAVPRLTSYADVKAMFDMFVTTHGIDPSGSPHGTFWAMDYDSFVTGDVPGVDGEKILVEGDADRSNLVRILKGPITFDGRTFEQMPAGGPFLSADMIDALADWINRECPR